MGINPDYQIIAQATPKPAPPAQLKTGAKIFPNLHKYPKIKEWVDIQEKEKKSADDIKNEFELIRNFCKENVPSRYLKDESGEEVAVFDPKPPITLPTNEKINIAYRKWNPETPEMGERFTIRKYKPISTETKKDGKIIHEIKYILYSTVIYEFFPNNINNPADKNNCRITKTYFEEIYKKDNKGQYIIDPQTGLYIHDKVKVGENRYLPKATDPKIKTIEIKNGNISFFDTAKEIANAEKRNIESAYPESPDEPTEAKAARRRRAKKTVQKAKINLPKNDPMVRYRGWPMKSSMAARFCEIEEALNAIGYKVQICSTTGGKHLSWQHPAGYAVDIVIYTLDSKGKRKYITKKDTITIDGKKINLSVYLEGVMNQVNKDKKLGLWPYNEYTHGSKYKTGDHFHIARIDFSAVAKTVAAEAGAKSISAITEDQAKDLVYETLVINGISYADLGETDEECKETFKQMVQQVMQEVKQNAPQKMQQPIYRY